MDGCSCVLFRTFVLASSLSTARSFLYLTPRYRLQQQLQEITIVRGIAATAYRLLGEAAVFRGLFYLWNRVLRFFSIEKVRVSYLGEVVRQRAPARLGSERRPVHIALVLEPDNVISRREEPSAQHQNGLVSGCTQTI